MSLVTLSDTLAFRPQPDCPYLGDTDLTEDFDLPLRLDIVFEGALEGTLNYADTEEGRTALWTDWNRHLKELEAKHFLAHWYMEVYDERNEQMNDHLVKRHVNDPDEVPED